MKTKFLIFALLLSLTATAQQISVQFNTPFIDIAELSRDESFRLRVGVAMYIKAGEALIDTTEKNANYAYYEKLFASQIINNADSKHHISLFTYAILTKGANLTTPDVYLYQGISALWENIVKAWMYTNGYLKMPVNDESLKDENGY